MPARKGKVAKRKAARTSAVRLQYGALPYRETSMGDLEILLVTSRETRRWIIPKGWPIKGLNPAKSAAREAYEEAGVRGAVGGRAIGSYTYGKRLADQETVVACKVRVFPLRVRRQQRTWPESQQRQTQWLPTADAVAIVDEAGLKALVGTFAGVRVP